MSLHLLHRAQTEQMIKIYRVSIGIRRCLTLLVVQSGVGLILSGASATPANKAAFVKYFGKFLPTRLDSCTTCHVPKKLVGVPASLSDYPHNSFGHRLALAADELRRSGRKPDIPSRLRLIAAEDSDGDGVDNLSELLLGHSPGDAKDRPTPAELKRLPSIKAALTKFLAVYRWQPFEPVQRPKVPLISGNGSSVRSSNPIDAFLTEQRNTRGLTPRPPAPKDVLLRRVYLDLIGLSPTPEAVKQFEADTRPDAFERVVDALLASPAYGERWGRHWMDVWRYSDWAGWADGNQIRDSKPFIWRWRDWIVESLNSDKGYDEMVREMLAADELYPDKPESLRATGFLVRNYKLLSREQWLDDLLNNTGRAFLGVTLGCAKCHNHMYDPITQEDYYRVRAVFEPHNVRTDRIPGQPDTSKDGLVHAFDADPTVPTYLFIRGDERNPDKSHTIAPGIPESLGGSFAVHRVSLPREASLPDRRDFVIRETIAAANELVFNARKELQTAIDASQQADPARHTISPLVTLKQRSLAVAEASYASLLAVLEVEKIEESGDKASQAWVRAATTATARQRTAAVRTAELNVELAFQATQAIQRRATPAAKIPQPDKEADAAQSKLEEAHKLLTAARNSEKAGESTVYKPRLTTLYPVESTGRRTAFALWLTSDQNPLTARVAVNQIWMRHFGTGVVPSVDDFGRNGRPPSNPQLLDWLASELMANHWRMKPIHRLIVMSSAYRMASTLDAHDAKIDPDDTYLWRMPSRRMEAETVRDNLLYVAGSLDETMGGPDIDHTLGLTSLRKSLYLRTAAEKQAEFLSIFDGPSVTECYARKPSVMPQQALALANSELAIKQAGRLAGLLAERHTQDEGEDDRFVQDAFLRVLCRRPTMAEIKLCTEFLKSRTATKAAIAAANTQGVLGSAKARLNLILVLFNHNDFVTIR